MTAALKSTAPPAPTAMAVKAHKRTLQLKLDALKSGAAEATLASAKGKPGAQAALATLYGQIGVTEFEIQMNDLAVERARSEDQAAEAAWRASIQELPPEEITRGMTRDSCGIFCVPGSYCAITGSVPEAAGVCSHPVLSRHLQFRDETGRRHFRYEDNPRAAAIYRSACRKLKV